MMQSPNKDRVEGSDYTDGPIAECAMDTTVIFSQSDGELDLTPIEESSNYSGEQEVILSESDEEYRAPRKKTRRGRPQKREASTSSTRVTRSSKKKVNQ